MSLAELSMALLVAASAVIYGTFVGRAQAARLRGLQNDLSHGHLRGYLVISAVIVMIISSFVFQR